MKPKQKEFADEYIKTGNATQSYLKVYDTTNEQSAAASANKLLRVPKVKAYIESVNEKMHNERIADMNEIREYWSNLVRNHEAEHKDRLKASEYIAKTNGAFLDKVQHSGAVEIDINIVEEE